MITISSMSQWFQNNKKLLCYTILVTFCIGMFAHGFAFSNINFSHDSLVEFHSELHGNDIKMGFGRVLTPIYRDLLGSDVTLPWLTGTLALLWIGLAVFLISRIFQVDSYITIFLISGICATNISVSAITATYIHDLDSYMFSLLLSVGAVFVWNCGFLWWIVGACLIAASLGIYQNFIFVAIALVMTRCILDLMNENSFLTVFVNGIKAIAMILLGGILYAAMMKLMLYLDGSELLTGEYNSLHVMGDLTLANIPGMICGAYADYFYRIIHAYSSYPSIMVKGFTCFLIGLGTISLALGLLNKKVRIMEKFLGMLLVLLFPLGSNMIYVLSLGNAHDLMTYPIWMFYIIVLLLSDWVFWKYAGSSIAWHGCGAVAQKVMCVLVIFALVYGNIHFSNGMYMKKALEHEAYTSLMTRVVARIESMEDYTPGETEVVVVGLPDNLNTIMPGFMDYWDVTGLSSPDVIYQNSKIRFQMYFDLMMGLPIKLAEDNVWYEISNRIDVQEMPTYPSSGFVRFIDDVLVIKLGQIHP